MINTVLTSKLNYLENRASILRICKCGCFNNLYSICPNCSNLITELNTDCYIYFYHKLKKIIDDYCKPISLKFTKLGLRFWMEFLISDLIKQTNYFDIHQLIFEFCNLPYKFLIDLIYIYLIKNNIKLVD